MKVILFLAAMLLITVSMQAQQKINLTIGNTSVTVMLETNPATEALFNHLTEGDVTVNTSRYGGFEQVGSLPWALPTSNQQLTTTTGDVILYSGNQLVVFFGSNSYSYTKLGKIENLNPSNLRQLLDVENCKIVLSLINTTSIKNRSIDKLNIDNPKYNVTGQRVQKSYQGIVVQDGRKYKKSK